MRPVSAVLGHLEHAIGRLGSPGLGHRIEELFATCLLVLGHLGFAIGSMVSSGIRSSSETATFGTWFSDLHLTTFPSLIKDGDTPFSIHRYSPVLRLTNPEIPLLLNLPTAPL